MASTSISMRCSGAMRRETSTMVMAGRMAWKRSRSATAICSHIFDVGDVVPDDDDVLDGGAGCGECGFDGVQGLAGLGFDLVGRGAVGLGAGGAGDEDAVVYADGAGIADAVFPWASGGDAGAASHVVVTLRGRRRCRRHWWSRCR